MRKSGRLRWLVRVMRDEHNVQFRLISDFSHIAASGLRLKELVMADRRFALLHTGAVQGGGEVFGLDRDGFKLPRAERWVEGVERSTSV